MENSFTLYKGCWLSKCPPHSSCYLKIDKCGKLLNRGGYLLRNVYDWDCEHETSFWFVIKVKDFLAYPYLQQLNQRL